MTQYKHERTCPFLRLMQLTGNLDYDAITVSDLASVVSESLGVPKLIARTFIRSAPNVIEDNVVYGLDDAIDNHLGKFVHEFSVRTDPSLIDYITKLDGEYVPLSEVIWYMIVVRQQNATWENHGRLIPYTSIFSTLMSYKFLGEVRGGVPVVKKSTFETFLRGDETVKLD